MCAARSRWGRAASRCSLPRQISGLLRDLPCWAWPLCVPVGGGPPARSPHASLRLGVVDLEARPGPATAHGNRGLALPPPTGTAAWPLRSRSPARLGPHFVRRRASKPARALRTLRRPPHQWGLVCWCVAWRVGLLFGQVLPPPINFARNSPAACLNIEFASLELQRFWGVLKNDRDKLRAKCGWRWCRRCPWAPQPYSVGQAAWLSETAVAFARLCLWGIETAIAFAGTGRASYETAIASASENWVFVARFSLALVLPVSMGVVHGRALVMVVSRWPVSVVAEVWVVSPSLPQCVLSAKKFALRGLVVGVSAKKFALHAQNTPKSAFLRLLGELFRGWGVGGGVLGELFRACRPATATSPGPPLPAGPTARPCGTSSTLRIGDGGGLQH